MSELIDAGAAERRHDERRANARLVDLTLPELRRIFVTSLLFAGVLGLFLWMVRDVVIAAILGWVIASYLRPLFDRIAAALPSRPAAALLTLAIAIVPVLGVVLYSYAEILKVGDYLIANQAQITTQILEEARHLPRVDPEDARGLVVRGVASAAGWARELPEVVIRSIGTFSVAATILVFTAFYVLCEPDEISSYVFGRIPARYAELVDALRENVQGVLYGAVYSTFLTQLFKSGVVLALNLAFDVPLAAVLAILAFVIGFFPIVGSWSVYLPVALWLLVFQDNTLGAAAMVTVGFLLNTLFFSMYLRPKLAADRSGVLNFYWMFVGLVTGVYTFGLAGLLLGPILIGLLKAILDTVSTPNIWRRLEREGEVEIIG